MAKQRQLAAEIVRLRSEGKTYDQIKAVLNCSKGTISYHLGPGQPEKLKARSDGYRAKVRNFIQKYKSETPCADCGQNFNYYVMQFDHLPQFTKSFTISKFQDHTRDLSKVLEEMKKCDLVCANCHTERGYQRRLSSHRAKEQVKNLLEFGLD
jgi:hypothetical protein